MKTTIISGYSGEVDISFLVFHSCLVLRSYFSKDKFELLLQFRSIEPTGGNVTISLSSSVFVATVLCRIDLLNVNQILEHLGGKNVRLKLRRFENS